MRNQRNKKRKKSMLPLLALLIVTATLVTAGLALAFTEEADECLIKYEGEHLDDRAQKIKRHFWEKNESNKEGDFSYEIETDLIFKGEDQACKIELANPHCNRALMYLELSLDEEGTVFLRTGLLRPGEKIKTITPDEPLEEGSYKGHASICAVDPETEEFLGFLEEEVTVTVRK